MTNIKAMFKDFVSNLKKYIDYLMKVNFKELFVNTVILFCILVLAAFVFIPIGIIQDIIRTFIIIFVDFSSVFGLLYNWIFYLFSFICAFFAFVYMFNKRFSDIEALKKQINDKEKSIERNKNTKKDEDEFELPREKNS